MIKPYKGIPIRQQIIGTMTVMYCDINGERIKRDNVASLRKAIDEKLLQLTHG